jgi:hypothetical protein
MFQRVRNQDKLAGAALAAGVAFAALSSADVHQIANRGRRSTMPRLVVFGFALALIACTQQGGREEAVSAAQPRDEATLAPPPSAPHPRDEAVPRATQPRDEATLAPAAGPPPPRDEQPVPRASQPRDEAGHAAPPSAPE